MLYSFLLKKNGGSSSSFRYRTSLGGNVLNINNLSLTEDDWLYVRTILGVRDSIGKIQLAFYLGGNYRVEDALIKNFKIIRRSESLDINNLSAKINPTGNLFYNEWDDSAEFYAPKNSQKTTFSFSNLWFSGYTYGVLKTAFNNNYFGFNYDYIAGSYEDNQGFNNFFDIDRVWKINKSEIDYHKANYNQPNYQIPEVIENWPSNYINQDGVSTILAPFENVGGIDSIYEPHLGDYPKIRGDQAILFVFSDKITSNYHFHLGVEVMGMAYAYNQPNDSSLHNTLFVNFSIKNKSGVDINNMNLGIYNDFKIGYYQDDFLGTDDSLNLFYAYNGLSQDGNDTNRHYMNLPPAQGLMFLNQKITSTQTLDVLYNSINRNTVELKMSSVDGTVYSGFPELGTGSTEFSANKTPSDRHGLAKVTQFNLKKEENICLDVAYPFALDYNGNHLSSIALLRQRAAAIQNFYDSQNFDCIFLDTVLNPSNTSDNFNKNFISLYPNPNNGQFFLESDVFGNQTELEIYSVLGKLIHREKITSPISNIAIAESKGIYIYLLKNQSEILKTGKLIVE